MLKTDVNENDYRYRNEKSGYDEGAKEIVLQHHNEGLSIRQIEEKTGVAKSTVQRWIKADDGKSVKKEMSQVSHY